MLSPVKVEDTSGHGGPKTGSSKMNAPIESGNQLAAVSDQLRSKVKRVIDENAIKAWNNEFSISVRDRTVEVGHYIVGEGTHLAKCTIDLDSQNEAELYASRLDMIVGAAFQSFFHDLLWGVHLELLEIHKALNGDPLPASQLREIAEQFSKASLVCRDWRMLMTNKAV